MSGVEMPGADDDSPLPQAADWTRFCAALADAGAAVHRAAAGRCSGDQRAQVDQGLLWMLASGTTLAAQLDPDRPDWVPIVNSALRSGAPNPDCVHHLTRIRGGRDYWLRGRRGSVKLVYMSVHQGFFGATAESTMLADFDLDDFTIAPSGAFEIRLGATRPAGYAGNWIPLDPAIDDIYLFVRQIAYDWLHEEDAELTIQPADPGPIGLRQDRGIARRLEGIPPYLVNSTQGLLHFLDAAEERDSRTNGLADHTGTLGTQAHVRNQTYVGGTIDISDDEAFCVELAIPDRCAYWNTQLRDSFFNGLDPIYHQTSLNGHSAETDPDGKVRIVVSRSDPGCANWLDKGDYARVVIRLRWLRSDPVTVTSRRIPLTALSTFLHPDTPMVSPAERAARLQARVQGAQRRRRW